MQLIWDEIRKAVPMILHGNPTLLDIIGFTLQVAFVATVAATVIGLPIGLAIGLGRFRGRNVLRVLANVSLAIPPVLVGVFLFVLFLPQAPLGSLHLIWTRRVVFIAQTILALPFVVALTAAAVQGLPPGLLSQARLLGAGRRATRDARASGSPDRRDRGGDRGARNVAVRGRRGHDPRREHLRLRPDARERDAVRGRWRLTSPTLSRSRSCCSA